MSREWLSCEEETKLVFSTEKLITQGKKKKKKTKKLVVKGSKKRKKEKKKT